MKTWAAGLSILSLIVVAVGLQQFLSLTRGRDKISEEIEKRLTETYTRLAKLEEVVGELRGLRGERRGGTRTSTEKHPTLPEKKELDEGTLDRIARLESQIGELREQLVAAFDSVSPIAPLGSPEEEIARADSLYESRKWSTALRAYVVVLQRYPRHTEVISTLQKAAEAFDAATQWNPAFLRTGAYALWEIEQMIGQIPERDQGKPLCSLASACMHASDYPKAAQFYAKAVRVLPDNIDKVDAYWSMAFALRETQGESAFLRILEEGRDLALKVGLENPANVFQSEISSPRPRSP